MRRASWFVGALALVSLPQAAQAFSEPLLYPESTAMGGGGGRFFTGSPLDSFSCAVCHEGGTRPSVTVRGFPESYKAGKKYEVEVSWTEPRDPHALTLEIVDTEGKAAGTIALPAADDVDEGARCVLSEDEAARDQVASSIIPFKERQILTVTGCGARNVRFSFIAPNEPKVALTASVVRSDKSEDVAGDGVLELRKIVYRNGEDAPSAEQGCRLDPSHGGSVGFSGLLAACAALVFRRRKVSASRG